MRPRCLKCKALADGITHGEAKKNHMEMRNARDTKRANDWKKTTEGKEMNWELTNINGFQRFAQGDPGDDSAMPDEDDAEGSKVVKPLSNRARKRLERVYMLKALNNVHQIFSDIAHLMLDKLRDMNEA